MAGHGAVQRAAYDAVARQRQRAELLGLSAYDRHRRLLTDLARLHGGVLPAAASEPVALPAPARTDFDALKEGYRFLRTEADDAAGGWEARLARRYYDRLFREYAIADLCRYKEGALGLRWRTQRELVAGTGQFTCGAKGCDERRGLASFEVPFAYDEAGQRKRALVKLRLCPEHAGQLQYKKRREREEAQRAEREEQRDSARQKEGRRKRRHRSRSSEQSRERKGKERRRREGSPSGSQGERRRGSPTGGPGAAQAGEEFEEFFQGLFG